MELYDYDLGIDIKIVKITLLVDDSDLKTNFLTKVRKAV